MRGLDFVQVTVLVHPSSSPNTKSDIQDIFYLMIEMGCSTNLLNTKCHYLLVHCHKFVKRQTNVTHTGQCHDSVISKKRKALQHNQLIQYAHKFHVTIPVPTYYSHACSGDQSHGRLPHLCMSFALKNCHHKLHSLINLQIHSMGKSSYL